MPPKVDREKCDCCKAEKESLCEQICPGDLMHLSDDQKAFCRMPRDCWDCMSYVRETQDQGRRHTVRERGEPEP